MIRTKIFCFICVIGILFACPFPGIARDLNLTDQEIAWINQHHTVRVRIGQAPPFMLTKGKIRGIAIDYLTHIMTKNGIAFEYVGESEVTWPQALEYIKQHKVVDMVPTAKITEDRKKDMIFTNEYLFSPWVIFTRSDADFVSSIKDLKGKTVSVEEGFVMHKKLKQEYPDIKLKVVSAKWNNYAEIPIRDLSTGLVDAYIGNLFMTTYLIQTLGYTNVKVAAPTPFDNHNQAMAIRNDWPELAGIINKTLAAMTPEEHAAIRNRWLTIKYEYGITKTAIFKWITGIAGLSSLFIGLVLFWNRRLKTEVASRTKVEATLRERESLLKEREEKYRLLFENMMNGFALHEIILDEESKPVDYVFLEINAAFENLTGLKKEKIIGQKVTAVLPGTQNDPADWIRKYGEVALTGREMRLELYSQALEKWFSVLAFSPQKGQFATIFEDITQAKETEEALRKSHQIFLTVLDSIDATVYVMDMETYEILFINKNMINSFGRDMTGEICWDVLKNEPGPCPTCPNHLIISKDNKPSGVHIWQARNPVTGKWYVNHDRAIEWTDGRLVKLQIATDVTEFKKMESELRQSHKMESIGILAGGIAHDFNNILSIIIGNAELALSDTPDWSPANESIQEIKMAGLRAKDVVRQLLSFSRKTEQHQKPVDLAPIIKDSLALIRASIPSSISIKENIPDTCDTILADATQIHQVMINLCTNAFHAMLDTGGILDIQLATHSLDQPKGGKFKHLSKGTYLELSVKDTGSGIDPSIRDKIFDPYFTTKEIGKGTGMGLAVVHGIVKNHNAAIFVDSHEDKGTSFSVFFPIISEKPDQAQNKNPGPLLGGTEKILFVDDETAIADVTGKMLKKIGYDVRTVTSPLKALDMITSDPLFFDLVISDMTMPDMTGLELSEKIKAIRPDIPIIICTGHSSLLDGKKVDKIGISAIAMKPVSLSKLDEIIRTVLGKHP